MADARIVAYADSTPPSGWLTCDGSSILRSAEPELFAAIGTTYGAADGTHFSLPDFRERFALGKSSSGTGSALGQSGGSRQHTHTLSHSHTVTQPGDHVAHVVTQPATHTAHVVTQPGAHANLSHAGLAADDHPATSHSGMSLSSHNVTESSGHGTHTSEGSHDHDTHTTFSAVRSSGASTVAADGGKHSSAGGHTHDAHSAHNEKVSAHTISSQGDDHAAESHSPTQPGDHALTAHAFSVSAHAAHAFSVSAHDSHAGAAAASATVTFGANDPPYLAQILIIAPATTPLPVAAVVEYAGGSVPSDHLICDGSAVSRATYADLFAIIDTTYGPGDGSTTFNVPDFRGRHVIGTGASVAHASSGGAADHTHTGASHAHAVTQPGDHADHTVTQPAHADHTVTQPAHSSLSHSGAAFAGHGTMSHSGFAVAAHSVTQSSGHGTHSSAGGHTHDAHSGSGSWASGSDLFSSAAHSSDGGHTHDSHGAHSGAALSAHAETQANAHTPTHTVTQPDDHTGPSHTGAALSAHSAHTGASLSSHGAHTGAALANTASADTGTAEAPFLALHYLIRTALGGAAIGSLYKVGQTLAPSGGILAIGQDVSRSTYADLFAEIGTLYGPGDGATTFTLPDLRGRIPRGANGDLGTAGGARDHTHTVSATHGHAPTQPDAHGAHAPTQATDHADHTPTQASDHSNLNHAGAAVATHSLSHSGAAVAGHSATQASAHGTHTSPGNHNHNAHSHAGLEGSGAFVTVTSGPSSHANEGGHDHSTTHPHTGFGVNAHSLGQANTHTLAHTVTQPSAHVIAAHSGFAVNTHSSHSGFAVDAHGAHSGFAVAASGTGTTDANNPPYLVVQFVIQAGVDVFVETGSAAFEATGDFVVSSYEVELSEPPNTPPSSPIVFILGPPGT